jgi:glycosyltransferase involved in cell wall biosynthesis
LALSPRAFAESRFKSRWISRAVSAGAGTRSDPDLVTVVIPAFDAARTIAETLRSVCSQTHRRLEILVVDDGSNDATPQIVQRHGAEDRRIRLVQQPNAGVAAARNRGIAEATSDLVAPIDADDLWHPEKIEKQLAALHRGGEAVALVYTWSAIIDADSWIIAALPGPTCTGSVVNDLFRGNIVGNGSSALMRKAAIAEAGGYDPSLRARSAQGLEDYQLYFRIATRHEFSVVPEHLTGYRRTANSMSANVLQMLRSRDIFADEMCRRYPERASEIRAYRVYFLTYLYNVALGNKQGLRALRIAALLLWASPLMGGKEVFFRTATSLAHAASRRLARPIRRAWDGNMRAERRRFLVGTPSSCIREPAYADARS